MATARADHRTWALNLALLVLGFVLACFIVEAGFVVRAGFAGAAAGRVYRFEDYYVSSRPIARFDRVTGYRRFPGPVRIVRIVRDELIYDQTFTPNNMGFISNRDYSYRKPTPDTTRVIVFGDSFTAAEYNPVSWPDRVHDALQREGRPMELYSFAINGAGLFNWHSVFFDDVVPHYEFDAVLIASYADDLFREFLIMHYDGPTAYFERFSTRPDSEEDFVRNYLPRMPRHNVGVASDAEIDAIINGLHGPWRWPGLAFRAWPFAAEHWHRFVSRRDSLAKLAATAALADGPRLYTMAEIEQRYGAAQFGRFMEMIAYCRNNGIPVILASVPTREGARNVARSRGAKETAHEREIKSLAHHLGTLHFDGYHPFAAVRPRDVADLYWLKYDGHWNQAGSDLFAAAMTRFLSTHADALRRKERAATAGMDAND